jgi:cytochrome P450
MTASVRVPALDLPDAGAARWTSFIKAIRQPQYHWPAQLLEQPIVARRIGQRTLALIADPEAAKTVLTGAADKFPRWRIYQHVVGRGPGRSSLSAAGDPQWLKLRRAFNPMFRPDHAALLVPLFARATARAVAAWQAKGDAIRVDASLEMTKLTLGAIWCALFGDAATDPPPLVERIAGDIHGALLRNETALQADKLAELADAAAARAPVRSVLPENPFDGFGAQDAARGDLTWAELYDNARGFLGAGHETTALTLTWALWLTAQDEATQARVHDEIDRVIGSGPIEDAHLGRLVFTGHVLDETLRLLPPAFVTVRQARDPVALAGERLPAGAVLAVCIYALHRHRQWWEAPDQFRPERFDSGAPRHRYAYLPFSAGRHACIGAALGLKEALAIFAGIMRSFSVSTDAAAAIPLHTTVTLRPAQAVPIILQRRR